MQSKIYFFSLLFLACLTWQCKDKPKDEVKPEDPKPRYTTVSTLAGGATGTGSIDGTGSAARFSDPYGIVKDSQGNFFVVDNGNQVIRKITSTGVVTTFAGTSGQSGDTDGTGAAARFRNPTGICIDASNNLYVAEFLGNRIRKITPAGVVTTFVGSTTAQEGSTDATGTSASFRGIIDIAIDAQNNIYVADANNLKIRKVTSAGVVTTIASNINSSGIFISPQGTLYVSNSGKINKVDINTSAVTVWVGSTTSAFADGTGTEARFGAPKGMAIDTEGNMYVCDATRIRKVTPAGVVSTIAGTGTQGATDGAVATATLSSPVRIYVDKPSNTIYFTDIGFNANKIRKID